MSLPQIPQRPTSIRKSVGPSGSSGTSSMVMGFPAPLNMATRMNLSGRDCGGGRGPSQPLTHPATRRIVSGERSQPMPRIEPIPWDEVPPKEREMIEAGMANGGFTDPLPLQIFAYAAHEDVPDDGDRHPNFPRHLLPGRLLELLRIRSAQLGGCEPCMASRKVPGAMRRPSPA